MTRTALRFLTATASSFLLLFSAGCSSSNESSSEASGHITRAETYAEQGQYRSAMLEVRNAVQKEPGNVNHVLVLAEIYNSIGAGEQTTDMLESWEENHRAQVALPLARGYILQGKHLSAREALEGFKPQSEAEQLEYSYLMAESQRLAGHSDDAIAQLRAIREDSPGNAEVTAALAKALIAKGDAQTAVNVLEQWTEDNGNNAEVLYLTGLAHYRLGNVDKSTAALTDATSSVETSDTFLPIRRNILTLLSRSLTEQGRISEAQVYNKILAENTNSDTLNRAEGALEAIQRGDLSSARTTLEELLQQNPENEQISLMLGTLNLQEGRVEDAESLLTGNIDAETTPTPFIRAATISQIDSGKREEALQTLARAIKARPNDADLLAMHGALALSLPTEKEAGVHSLSKALDIDPTRSRLRLALARHYISEDQQEQALAQMRVAFTESPTDWVITRNYIALLLQGGNEGEASEVAESLLNGFSDDPRAVTLAAITEYRLGEVEQARSRLENQVQEQSDNLSALVALSAIYQSENNHDKAVETLLKAARLRPDSFQLMQAATRAYARSRQPQEVVDWLGQVASEHEELAASSRVLAASILTQLGKLAEARERLSLLPEEDHSAQARTVRTRLLVAEAQKATNDKDWATARAKAGEAAAMQPEDVNVALVPVQVSIAEGKYDEALQSIDELEDARGEHAALDVTRARLFAVRDGAEEAFEYLQKRWQETENTALLPVMVNLARQHSPSEMDQLTESWVEAHPQNAAANISRAEYQMSSGDVEGAIASYETVVSLHPDNVSALNNLAWLLREEDPGRGLEVARRAARLAPESAAVQDTYGWLLHLNGQTAQARDTLEKAQELEPENKEITQHLETVRSAL